MDSKRNGLKNITAVFARLDVDTLNVFKIERIEEQNKQRKGNIMERNFSFDDAKNLIHRHKRLQARLIDFMNAEKRYMDMVSDILGRYITT